MEQSESRPAGKPSASLKRQSVGAAMVVFSTIAIAVVPSLAKFAHDSGSNTLSIITGRSIFSVVITFALLVALRQPLVIAGRPLFLGMFSGVVYAIMLYGYIGAVEFIPVNLVILIYFVHPLLVGLIFILLGQERATRLVFGALAAAFAGLVLAIGFSVQELNLAGLGLAGLAMVMAALTITANAIAMRDTPGLTVAFHMMLWAAISLALLFALFGTVALPSTQLGWFGFLGVALASTAGTLTFMCGMAYIGATRAAMISNLEPILGVVFALAVLGERITLLQSAGVALVLGAIALMELRR